MRAQPWWWSVADKDEKGLVPVKTLKLLHEQFANCSFIRREIKNRCEIESQEFSECMCQQMQIIDAANAAS